MSKRHDAVFDDVLKDFDASAPSATPARFLKRSSTLAEQAAGARQEKVLRLVDPASCQMWEHHNRAYELLTEESCRDLIDGILSQGQQEFPAIVRRLPEPKGEVIYEVICGARRHFAISWLRANNYPRFRYLIEERDLTDEEAFRLADIENRDREDISDFERARDYAKALPLYYAGKQSEMAARLQVSPAWLSRYLELAKLEPEIIAAFASIRDLREAHARQIKPLMGDKAGRAAVLAAAKALADEQKTKSIPAATVVARLKKAVAQPKAKPQERQFRYAPEVAPVTMRRKGTKVQLEFDAKLSDSALKGALELYLAWRKDG